MKFLIQRVTKAQVDIAGSTVGKINKGYLVLIGIAEGDSPEIANRLIRKMMNLRIFADENGKTNLSLKDVNGELLLVSQFTLYANCNKGNRPTFNGAGNPQLAKELYQYIIEECRKEISVVETGEFGADMQVSLTNDGPFTLMLE
ncbi:MAG: D-tyrosyl-tRNA(Tyr) deacylase [Fibrobacter sp.]|nr:D-tyrosyl-tRNA(Tyr) deacylase [Fibrobacter sp.]